MTASEPGDHVKEKETTPAEEAKQGEISEVMDLL